MDNDQNARYRVLSPEGEYLGDTEWPIRGGIIMNGYLLGWINFSTGQEPIALVFRIHSRMSDLVYWN
jgi:hypothetical protein